MRFTILAAILVAVPLASQAPTASRPQKDAVVTRVRNGSISVDGAHNDAGWSGIAPIADFVQKEPVEGGRPTDKLEIRLAYDDAALYVATRVTSSNPSSITFHHPLPHHPRSLSR